VPGRYQVVHGWPVLPESRMLGLTSTVAVDAHNHVFVFERLDRTWPDSGVLDLTPLKDPGITTASSSMCTASPPAPTAPHTWWTSRAGACRNSSALRAD
jgi:hypothetical protein